MTYCVIFDLDGTLVDSESLCNQAFLDLVPEIHDDVDELLRRYRGARFATILADLSSRHDVALPADFEPRYRARVASLFESSLKPMPGALEMLEELAYPRCIASGGPLAKIRHSLQISGLNAFFGDRLFSSYDIGSWKPDPGLFVHAAKAMGFSRERCVVIEDSDAGIEAAKTAGMRHVRYIPGSYMKFAVQDSTIGDLRDLPKVLAGWQVDA